MTQEIKKRIEQIRRGEVPEGYIKTKAGIAPQTWSSYLLGELGTSKNGLNFHRDDKGYKLRVLGVGDFKDLSVLYGVDSLAEISLSSMPEDEMLLQDEDIVFVRSNGSKELVGRNLLVYPGNRTASYSGFCIRFRMTDKSKTTPEFINSILDNNVLKKKLQRENQGSNITNLNQDILNELVINVPSVEEEQKKIMQVLKVENQVITLKEKWITEKQRQKKYLMQQLLTGKKRLNGFSGEWKMQMIGSFIIESDERSIKNNQYEILSVTKNGIVKQSEHFNKQIASEDNTGYKILKKGNLAFSAMNMWMGSLDVLEEYEVGIISPAYKVFNFIPKVMSITFGKQFMKSQHLIWLYNIHSEQGASIVRKNLDLDSLLAAKVKIPPVDEQNAISRILATADREIELLQKDLDAERQKKKALMQLLLTGIVRVNEC